MCPLEPICDTAKWASLLQMGRTPAHCVRNAAIAHDIFTPQLDEPASAQGSMTDNLAVRDKVGARPPMRNQLEC